MQEQTQITIKKPWEREQEQEQQEQEQEQARAMGKDKRPILSDALTSERYAALERELRIAAAQGQCKGILRGIRDKLLCAEPTNSWADLALMLSLNLKGQFWVGSNGISWVQGRLPVLCIAPQERLDGIKDGRQIVAECTGLDESTIPCSSAAQARKLLQWVDIKQTTARALDFIGASDSWAYQHCEPTNLPQAYLWDITACYFSLLKRAPSPLVLWTGNKLHWCNIEPSARERWNRMLKYSESHKGIRNSFIGQMYASSDGLYYTSGKANANATKPLEYMRAKDGVTLYQKGLHLDHSKLDERVKPEEKQVKPGPLRPLASLIVRSAYELCALAKEESKAFYANTDCVITEDANAPKIWGRYGMKCSLKGQGATSIYAIGYYHCGEAETKHIDNLRKKKAAGIRCNTPNVPAQEEPIRVNLRGKLWIDEWLQPSDSWSPE